MAMLPSNSSGFLARGGLWVIAQGIVLVASFGFPPLVTGILRWQGSLHQVVGGVLFALGLVELLAGVVCLREGLTPLPRPKEDAELKTNGVYRYVRHPIYGGLVLVIAGYCLASASIASMAAAVIATSFFVLKSRLEERWLSDKFSDYRQYANRTKGLIPWIY